MPLDLDLAQDVIGDWQDKTFPHGTVHSKLEHLKDEIAEVQDDPNDLLEWADLLILLMGAARLAGFSMSQLMVGVEAKHIINQRRDWGEPDERGVVKHV